MTENKITGKVLTTQTDNPKKTPRQIGTAYILAILLATITVITVSHEAAHYIAARYAGVAILEASFGFGPRLLTYESNGTKYSISSIPIGGYVSMAGETEHPAKRRTRGASTFNHQPEDSQLRILLAGPLSNIIIGALIILILKPPTRKKQGTTIERLVDGSPAQQCGIIPGDTITAINSTQVNTAFDLYRTIAKLPPGEIQIQLTRQGKTHQLSLIPTTKKGFSPLLFPIQVPFIGIHLSQQTVTSKNSTKTAIREITRAMAAIALLPITIPIAVIRRHIKITDYIIGPIGLYFMMKAILSSGKATVMEMFAMISLSVGFTNLLPIPVLDGGRAAIILGEKAAQQTMPGSIADTTNITGAMVLLILVVFTFYSDISKLRRTDRKTNDPFNPTLQPPI